jgi:hypothetical protein
MDKSSRRFLKIRVNPRRPRHPRSNYTKLSKLTWVAETIKILFKFKHSKTAFEPPLT